VRIPAGAEVLTNPTGMAPGFTVENAALGKARLSFMPGVPREMKPMFEQGLAGPLAARVGDALVTRRRTFRMAGIGESHVDHALKGLIAADDATVTLHFRIAFPENLVTLVVRRATEAEAEAQLAALSEEVRVRLGDHIYGTDQETLPSVIGRRLREKKLSLSLAESCTGGMLGSLITDVPGASAYFAGGVVAYANGVKTEQLAVPPALIAEHGAVSEAVALAMAAGVRTRLSTDWAIALTGVAGPDGGTADKPVGTVWIALHGPDGARAKKLFWPGDREQVRRIAAVTALHLLYKALR
jgi:nicotinamide-nucleotide amidase